MIVKKLRPHVTTFSEAMAKNHKHGDHVVIGGLITNILDIGSLLPKAENGESQEGVYITLDDGVGYNEIVLPSIVYEAYKEELQLEVGMVVLAEGKIYELDTTHTEKSKKTGKTTTYDKHPEQTIRVLCWKVRPLPEDVQEVNEVEA